MSASGSRAYLPEGTAPGSAKASTRFSALDPGRTDIVFKKLSVEVLLSMSALRICMGISTTRSSRIPGL